MIVLNLVLDLVSIDTEFSAGGDGLHRGKHGMAPENAQIRISGTSLEFFSRKECVTPGSNMVFWSPDMDKICSKKNNKIFSKKEKPCGK